MGGQMKKMILMTAMLFALTSLFGVYTVGQTVVPADNLSWTTTTGYTTSIFEQTALGKATMIFWGEDW